MSIPETQKPEPQRRQYGVWTTDRSGDEHFGYWNMYDSLEDAVAEHGTVEIYRLDAKPVGTFKRAIKTVRVKRRKKTAVKPKKKRSKKA